MADANTPLRDEDGILVSFESETPGISLEEDYEEVRLENKQFFFTGQIDNEFTYYFQPITEDTQPQPQQQIQQQLQCRRSRVCINIKRLFNSSR